MRQGEMEARAGEGRAAAHKRRRQWRDRTRPGCSALAASAVLFTASVCGRAPAANANTLKDALTVAKINHENASTGKIISGKTTTGKTYKIDEGKHAIEIRSIRHRADAYRT